MGTYPIAARTAYAGGDLLVISDPDVFINSMLDKGDNAAFMSDVLTGTVLVDVSHGMDVTPVGSIYYVVKLNQWAQALAAVLILFVLLAFMARKKIFAFTGAMRRKR